MHAVSSGIHEDYQKYGYDKFRMYICTSNYLYLCLETRPMLNDFQGEDLITDIS